MAAAPAAPRIFVSYARSDGKKFAAELRSRLQKDHGFPLWQDLADMEGGKDWWQQITEAIDHVEFLVLVMTPAAFASPIVRKEWRYARQQGRCVIPVIGAKGIDFEALPGWMRRAHFVDPAEPDQWRRFVRTLEAPCKATRAPFMVEDLPEVFVRRPREFESLVASLLDQTGEEPVAITAALKGAGGYGKTTLARAICHEERVQGAFDDGILWVTLGEQPGDIQSRVVDLIEVLTGERPGFQTTEAAITRLGEVIGERRMLIVIDDVWQAAHARPFLQAGPNCARLITTRNRDVLPPNAKPLDVDAMTASEALRLLRFGLPDGEDAACARLAQRLGEWPLLLKLVNGALHKRVAAGQPLAAALAWVNAGLYSRGLTVFDARNPTERGDAVAKTLDVSLELFTEDERARFSELAIFPEDLDVPLAAVETLWSRTVGLDEFETELLCTRLYDQSLLLGLDLATRHIRLHDVVRGYLRAEQKERLPALHSELFEAYRARCPDGWHTGPDDGYFFQYLPWHLREGGQAGELQQLLFDYRWLRAKLEVVGLTRVIQDFEQLGTDEQSHKMAAGLHLSAHALASDSKQLANQLLGRLVADDGPEIAALLTEARQRADRPALLPLHPTLTPAGMSLIRILSGHRADVFAVSLFPDGKRALSASRDGMLHVWDLENGAALSSFRGHSKPIGTVAVLPDSKRALSGSFDSTLRLWDLEAAAEICRFDGHSGGVEAVAVLPDGKFALSGSWDNTLRLWDLESGAELRRFDGHSDGVKAVAVLPDGKRALSGSKDHTLRLWDLESGAELRCFDGHSGRVQAVAVLPDGKRALSGSFDNRLCLWDLENGAEIHCFGGHSGPVAALAVLRDGEHALSASYDTTLRFWKLASGAELGRFEGHSEPVVALAVLADGKRAISGSWDNTLRLWDLENLVPSLAAERHTGSVTAVAVLPDSKHVLSASHDNTLRLWDLERGIERRRFEGHSEPVVSLAVLPDGTGALSASYDNTLRLWQLESGREAGRIECHSAGVTAIAVLPGGERVLCGCSDNTLRLWDLQKGVELQQCTAHNASVAAVAVLPDARHALSGSYDDTLRLWDLENGAELRRFHGHSEPVVALAILRDGKRALSGSWDKTLRLWDLDTGAELRRFEGHGLWVGGVAVLPHAERALSCSDDNTLRLWNLETGSELARLTGDASFPCCAIAPDGRFALAGDSRGQVHVLEILL